MVAAISTDTLLGAAAAITAVAGLVMTVVSFFLGRKDATKKAEAECHKLLMAEQRVSEGLSAELHELRMKDRS